MSITTVKVLRTISKIVLLIVGIGIIGYGGLMVYKSVVNKPQKVRVTNVTDSAATITWVTDNPVRGVVYYREEGSFLPGPLGLIGSKVAYDDRDFARAQDECVKAFNENAKNTKDANFTVDGSTFDCENIPVEKLGAYYTHSVTIKNLNDSGTYFFVVGNGIWSWNVGGVSKEISENDLAVANSFNFKTSQLLEEVPTPNIAYGTVYAGVKSVEGYLSESLSKDSLVFAYLTIGGINSQTISAVTNTDGGWTFDKSNFRDTEGNLIVDLSKATMMVRAQYEDVEEARWIEITEGLDGDTELDLQGNLVDDLETEEKGNILEKLEMLIGKVYAIDSCPNPIPSTPPEYTCESCHDGYSVSGCNYETASCLKSCAEFVRVSSGWQGYSAYNWVVKGYVRNGTCPMPTTICGCNPGTCEDIPGTSNHKTCQSGNYWSGPQSGSCNPPESTDCKKGDCRKVSGGHQMCVIDTWGSTLSGGCPVIEEPVPTPTVPPAPTPTTPTATIQEQCTITPHYTETQGVFRCLPSADACTKECGNNKSSLSETECKNWGIKRCLSSGESSGDEIVFDLHGLDLHAIGDKELKELVGDPVVRAFVINEIEGMFVNHSKEQCEDGYVFKNEGFAKKLCKVLNKTWGSGAEMPNCESGQSKVQYYCGEIESYKIDLVSPAYAQDSGSDGYTLYLPEYGMYSFQLGDYELTTSTTGGNTYYIFYIETNDKKGFQMPVDPDNPTEKEDIMLKSSSSSITYEKVSSAQSYTLVKGINLVSFNFIPVSTDLGPLTAKGVIDEATKKGVTIQYISSFDGGRWSKGYTCKNDKCSGNDFNILPGKGYLVYATKGGEMTIPGYNLKTSVPVNISGGWNLVGIHGYTTAYTARTLIDSMSKIDGVTANNVTWWPTSKGMYEGLQVTGEQQYGFDFPISPTNGYFVRISSFKPKDSKCKSLLWNEGGTLNGSCGIIK